MNKSHKVELEEAAACDDTFRMEGTKLAVRSARSANAVQKHTHTGFPSESGAAAAEAPRRGDLFICFSQ